MMIVPINLTEEYRRQRQDVMRRKQNFSLTRDSEPITSNGPEQSLAAATEIPWLDDYSCALAAINDINEACAQQTKSYEILMRSRRSSINTSLDRQVLHTANIASERIREAKALLSKVTPTEENLRPSEIRMRYNAAKSLTVRLKTALTAYNDIHNRVMATQTQLSSGELELTAPQPGGKSPPPEERLKTQLIMPERSEQLFSSNQINQMHGLMQVVAQLFDDTNYLIIEQGSMLDRIDQNIDLAIQKTLQSKQQIKKAVYNQKHGFAKQTWVLLMILNSIMLVLNMCKFYLRF